MSRRGRKGAIAFGPLTGRRASALYLGPPQYKQPRPPGGGRFCPPIKTVPRVGLRAGAPEDPPVTWLGLKFHAARVVSPAVPKISFYRVNVGLNPSGVHKRFDHDDACDRIAKIKWGHRRAFSLPYGASLVTESSKHTPTRVTFASVRYDQELVLAKNGVLEHQALEKGVGTAALSRVVFFPENIVGVTTGPMGPSTNQIAKFILSETLELYGMLKLVPLYRGDQLQLLNSIAKKLTRLHLTIRPDAVKKVPPGNMANAVQQVQAASGAEGGGKISIDVRADKKGKLTNVAKWIKSLLASDAESGSDVVVTGYNADEERVDINFSNHRFDFKWKPDGKPSTLAHFKAIEEYYEAHSDELAGATGFDIETE